MKKNKLNKVILKRFKRKLTSKEKKKNKRILKLKNFLMLKKILGNDLSLESQFKKWLPETVRYFLSCEDLKELNYTDYNIDFSKKQLRIFLPKTFCLNTNINNSLSFIYLFISNVIADNFARIIIDYKRCKEIDISAQICFDSLFLDTLNFLKKRKKFYKTSPFVKKIRAENMIEKNVNKILFSIGSPSLISNKKYSFDDIIPYHLCIHNKENESLKNSKRKEIDTTKLVEHVIESLGLINKELSGDAIDDLSTVIGEILINAEEHSTLNQRYSTGYFQKIDENSDNKVYGVYHLAILNFGKSIYEIFKDPKCKNIINVEKMRNLSERYTKRGFFNKTFPEESLWTLYSLQDGITSTSPSEFKKRGNGSIRFIESFFNLRSKSSKDSESRLNIISGYTNIIFDGKYEIENKIIDFFNYYDNLIQKINENFNAELTNDEKSILLDYFLSEAKIYRQKFYDLLLSINIDTYQNIKRISDELIDFLTEKLFDDDNNYLNSNYISQLEDKVLDSRKKSLKKIFSLINSKQF